MSPGTPATMEPTNFLSLPRELRDKIYEYTLVHHKEISIRSRRLHIPKNKRTGNQNFQVKVVIPGLQKGLSAQLLRTSKTIHAEAITILYGLNTFDLTYFQYSQHAGCDEELPTVLETMGRYNVRHIRRVMIDILTTRDDLYFLWSSEIQGPVTSLCELEEVQTSVLDILEEYCEGIRAVTIRQCRGIRELDRVKDIYDVNQEMESLDARFKSLALPTNELNERNEGRARISITIRLGPNSLSNTIRDKLKSYGWAMESDTAPGGDEFKSEDSTGRSDEDDNGYD